MAFDFSKWADCLPEEARQVLVDEGYDNKVTLLSCTQEDIQKLSMKTGHKIATWKAVSQLQEENKQGQPIAECSGSGLSGQTIEWSSGSGLSGQPIAGSSGSEPLNRSKAEIKDNDPGEIRIVLFGKTGSGKSSTGNTILGVSDTSGTEGFEEVFGQQSGTVECRVRSGSINGRTVKVVDTPGVCDTRRDADEVLHEVSKCLLFASPGPHILLFVLNGQSRFTKEEYDAYMQMRAMFDPCLTKYVCIVFSRCDDTKSMEKTLEIGKKSFKNAKDEGRETPDINQVLAECNGRYLLFDNKGNDKTKDQQVRNLLKMIDNLQSVNFSQFFEDAKTKATARQKEVLIEKIMRDRNIVDRAEAWRIIVTQLEEEEQLKKEAEEWEVKQKLQAEEKEAREARQKQEAAKAAEMEAREARQKQQAAEMEAREARQKQDAESAEERKAWEARQKQDAEERKAWEARQKQDAEERKAWEARRLQDVEERKAWEARQKQADETAKIMAAVVAELKAKNEKPEKTCNLM